MALTVSDQKSGFEYFRTDMYGNIETCFTGSNCYPTYAAAVEASAATRQRTIANLESQIADLKAIDAHHAPSSPQA